MASAADELAALKEEADSLREMLGEVEQRMEALAKDVQTADTED